MDNPTPSQWLAQLNQLLTDKGLPTLNDFDEQTQQDYQYDLTPDDAAKRIWLGYIDYMAQQPRKVYDAPGKLTLQASMWLNRLNNILYSRGRAEAVDFSDGGIYFDYSTGMLPSQSATLILSGRSLTQPPSQ